MILKYNLKSLIYFSTCFCLQKNARANDIFSAFIDSLMFNIYVWVYGTYSVRYICCSVSVYLYKYICNTSCFKNSTPPKCNNSYYAIAYLIYYMLHVCAVLCCIRFGGSLPGHDRILTSMNEYIYNTRI